MLTSHSNIEKSFYKYINEAVATPFNYVVSYGNLRFKTDAHNLWIVIEFEEMGAGAKDFSSVQIDVVSRIVGEDYANDETTILDVLRTKLTNVNTPLYDFATDPPVLVPSEKLIVKNSKGRRTVDRIVFNNLKVDDLKDNLRRSSIFLRLMLLTDTTGGRVI